MKRLIFITDGNTNIHLGMVIKGILHMYVRLFNKTLVG